jgi:homoaconitase
MSNMGAEVGATTSCFGYNDAMGRYLDATGRSEVKAGAQGAAARGLLSADKGAEYDERIEINLDTLEPCLNGPFTPDLSTSISEYTTRAKDAKARDHPLELSAALIGSCTNSSYNDLARCSSLAKQALDRGMKVKCSFDVTPGSEQVRATVERDGITSIMEQVGGRVLANACGPCIGQWDRKECQGEENVILTSFNRNFRSRNDGNSKTHNMLASPEIVTAMAFAGRLDFNPMTDSLTAPDGKPFKFDPPVGDELPVKGFTPGEAAYLPFAAPEPQPDVEIAIDPTSTRLEHLQPFGSAFSEGKYELDGLRCLMRIKGKCTTDHISAAGPWLKYKGHLSNLAENTLIGATNAETDRVNSAVDYETGKEDTIPNVAKAFKARNQPWVLVADHNYGEGSAREHAALQPRFFGCQVIVARSLARIAETNLRKQGVLTLLFANENDYELISAGDEISTKGLEPLMKPNGDLTAQVTLVVRKPDGKVIEIPTKHTLSKAHIDWIRAGSALNVIREQATQSSPSPSGSGAGLFGSSSRASGSQARAYSTFAATGARRGYATGAKPSGNASKLNPNDPRYVPPASDTRTDALRRMVYPPAADAEASRRKAQVPETLDEALPYGREVHETIDRAWKLFQRTRREALSEDLRVKRERMAEAVADLRSEDARLYRAATYRVAPTRRSPSEQAALIELGVVAATGKPPATPSAEQRRFARSMLGRRLEGMFPREMRVPTVTPARKIWNTGE